MFDDVSTSPEQPPADPGSAVGELLARLAERPADSRTVAALERIDPQRLDPGAKVDFLRAVQRVSCWAAAAEQRGLSAIDVAADGRIHRPEDFDDDWAREQVGAALRLHPITANRRLTVARTLTDRFPSTLTALAEGRINYLQAAHVAETTAVLPAELHGELESRVLPKAERQTVGETGRTVERTVIRLDPRAADERHRSAKTERRMAIWRLPDAMAEVRAVLGADAALTMWTALNGLAEAERAANPGDPRTVDQLRADKFAEVFDAILTGGDVPSPLFPPTCGDADHPDDSNPFAPIAVVTPAAKSSRRRPRPRRRKRAQLIVTACSADATPEPGELDGYGPIPPSMVRQIAADADVTAHSLEDVDTAPGYRPNTALDRFVRTRDRRCTFPGCSRRAALCDLDHIEPWPQGPTSAENLHCLCRRHHRLKTLGYWKVRRTSAGGLLWTSPTGHRYRAPPPSRDP